MVLLALWRWSSGFTYDQARLYAQLFSLAMRIALEVLERIEEDLCQLLSRQSQCREWGMDDIAHVNIVETYDR
jgi:hypothetical protein